uniref:Uncharacterized protein n=1 Tax=Rhizophora mucronata TaxID=61149 RepID=A0A2P2NDN3_RHIMU
MGDRTKSMGIHCGHYNCVFFTKSRSKKVNPRPLKSNVLDKVTEPLDAIITNIG